MAFLNVDHPNIEVFIKVKDDGDLAHYNISVGISNKFMRAVKED
jgi:ribonucleoside-diphosphate reductase alpha chain